VVLEPLPVHPLAIIFESGEEVMSKHSSGYSLFRTECYAADRRSSGRSKFHMRAKGERTDNTVHARRNPHVALSVQDFSVGGIAAVADQPMECGEHVALYFPPFGTGRGCDRYGKIVRCELHGKRYDIGIRFDRAVAA
jgi:hypothetical protein